MWAKNIQECDDGVRSWQPVSSNQYIVFQIQ